MSNYEFFYYLVVGDGMSRLKAGAIAFFGVVFSLILFLIDVAPASYMFVPAFWYIYALYERSKFTKKIFDIANHPGYSTLKIMVFVTALIMYYAAKNGHLPITIAYSFELIAIIAYSIALLYTSFACLCIDQKAFEEVFHENYGSMTDEDIAASKKLFKKNL